MTKSNAAVNAPAGDQSIAALTNVALTLRALDHAINRPGHLPGIVGLHGPSGLGKTTSATYAANKTRAFYVEVKSSWTRKALLRAILREMGIEAATTNYDMVEQVANHLALHQRPLIIDEFDHVVDRNMVDLVRDIYETSNTPILIIGEERVEQKLRKFERFHNRVLEWVPAQPADMQDVHQLAKLYCRDIKIDEDLLQHILQAVHGCVRRVCVNLETVRQAALQNGWKAIDLKAWGKRELYTGNAAPRRI